MMTIIKKQLKINIIKKFYKNLRTHIKEVETNIYKIINKIDLTNIQKSELKNRICIHDQDKFGLSYIPIIQLYEYKQKNTIPIDVKTKVSKILKTHKKTNKHHPEYYKDINKMSIIDVVEFTCDVSSIYKIYEKDKILNTIINKYQFNKDTTIIIQTILDIIT